MNNPLSSAARSLRRRFRIVRGWARLNLFDCCPHCNSDAARPCPVCSGLAEPGKPVPPCNYVAVWERFVRMVG